jgi:hypothetical protein
VTYKWKTLRAVVEIKVTEETQLNDKDLVRAVEDSISYWKSDRIVGTLIFRTKNQFRIKGYMLGKTKVKSLSKILAGKERRES